MDEKVKLKVIATLIDFVILQLLELFNQFSSSVKVFPRSMLQAARLLLTNQQGGPLAQMTITPDLPSENITLCSIIVHCMAVFSSNATCHILLPFVNMLTNPAALTVSYYGKWLFYCCYSLFFFSFSIHTYQLWQKITYKKSEVPCWGVLSMVGVGFGGASANVLWFFAECPRGHPYFVGEVHVVIML